MTERKKDHEKQSEGAFEENVACNIGDLTRILQLKENKNGLYN